MEQTRPARGKKERDDREMNGNLRRVGTQRSFGYVLIRVCES